MSRRLALEALERCRRNGAWSGQVLDALLSKSGLDARDAAMASRLFFGTLQNETLLDHYIGLYARGKLEPKVRDILRLGAYQILFMDRVPDRAAVSEAVEQCRRAGHLRACGLVNAVLRKLSDHKNELPEIPDRGTAKYLSIRYSHPLWLTQQLLRLRSYAGAEALLAADNEPAPTYIQTNTLKTTPEALAKALDCRPFEGLTGCFSLQESGDLTKTQAFRDGLFYVQDPAAQLAVRSALLRPGMRVLDACAAPGGKSFAAAMIMRDSGSVIARDISSVKLSLVAQGAQRLGIGCIRCEPADACEPAGESFDAVLADVPCSGLGVIRKKPDIRCRDEAQLAELPALQRRILQNLSQSVKPGGVLVYSTCTWREAENAGVTSAFITDNDHYTVEEERTLWPDLDGTDGFYICRMRRKN